MMKAIVVNEFGGPDVLRQVEMERPTISARQVLIRVVATSVNFADIMTRQGEYHSTGKPPLIPGLDAAGIIEEVGTDVRSLRAGQRVVAFPKSGSYAEYIVADEDLTFVIPDNVGFEVAAASPLVAFTSYKLLADVARLQKGETVLIHAASGGIGTTAIQIARILGASLIIGTVGNGRKAGAVLAAGADEVIAHDEADFVERVNALTEGRGVDIILDSIAGETGERSLECLAKFGRLVNFGRASGEAARFRTTDLHSSCRSVLGFSFGTTRNSRPELVQETAEKVMGYLQDGLLDMKIGKRFALKDAAEAHRLVESRLGTGKVLLVVDASGL